MSRGGDIGLFAPMIRLERVHYRYPDGTVALKDITLRIDAGESVCVMGSNGSGKSTLAHLMAGLLTPTEGTLTINGESLLPAGSVGLLFQDPDSQMVATLVEKDVAFGLENKAVPPGLMMAQVDTMLQALGVSSLKGRLTTELSGGEKQLAALAGVMVTEPPVLILDEPDAFLDAAAVDLLESRLSDIHRRRSDLIELRITQSVRTATRYARLVVTDQGRVLADGPPQEVLDDSDVRRVLGIDTNISTKPITSFPAASRTPSAAKLTVNELSFGYRPDRPVLVGVSCYVSQGEIVGLCGATGSGKSTLGSLLCRLLTPDAGVLEVTTANGSTLVTDDDTWPVVGAFQQPERQFFLKSCAEEVAFGPRNRGKELSSEQIDGFLQLVGLSPEHFGHRDPFTLSVGEKRRLAFAAILSLDAPFYVFDEPTAALDGRGVRFFRNLAMRLRSAGKGICIISHDLVLLSQLADRCYMLQDGRLQKMSLPAADSTAV